MEEFVYNLCWSWKKPWNRHVRGTQCWCKPIVSVRDGELGGTYVFHQNYIWEENQWKAIQDEPRSL